MNRLSYIAPHTAGAVCAMVAAATSVIILASLSVIAIVSTAIGISDQSYTTSFTYLLMSVTLFPLIYAVSTYLFVLITTWIYNHVAQKTGGIAYRTQPEKDQEQAQHV